MCASTEVQGTILLLARIEPIHEVMNFDVWKCKSKNHQSQQQGTVLHVTVIQLVQCVVLFCVQMQNLHPVSTI